MEYLYEFLDRESKKWEIAIQKMRTQILKKNDGSIFCRSVNGKIVPYRKMRMVKDGVTIIRTKSLRAESPETVQEQINRQHLRRQMPKYERNLRRLKKLLQDWEHPGELKKNQILTRSANKGWDPKAYGISAEFARRWSEEQVTVFEAGQIVRVHGIVENGTVWHPEGLRHVTADGELRRSKSEVILDEILKSTGLVYAYERPLYIGGKRYLPDYTILRPSDLQPIFLEHYGMTGEGVTEHNEENQMYSYALRNEEKRLAYQRAGIVPWKNLIYTYDLPDGSVDVRGIRKVLELFLEL
ncbi:MAG: hypothetical protein E7223_05255 [Clostridiales bacterium]|nr:hypothetical protein [Clostridiales bacterium]